MTAEELKKSVAIELFRTDDPEGYQQYDAGILVSFPDVYKELARMAIRVCMEAAMKKCTDHAEFIRGIQSDFENKGYNTAPKVADQLAHEWDWAALQISTLLPKGQQ